jgi:hypothetical protein
MAWVISIRKCNIFEKIVKNKYTCCKVRMQAANLEGVITLDSSRCLVDPWTSATFILYYPEFIY